MKVLSTGKVMYGMWNAGRMEGFMRTITKQGEIFEGKIENNKKNGVGRVIQTSGDSYYGFFEAN